MERCRKKLHLFVSSAQGLAKRDIFGLSDPYVTLEFYSTGVKQTKTSPTIRKTSNPVFNYLAVFDVLVDEFSVIIDVHNANALTRDGFLGRQYLHFGANEQTPEFPALPFETSSPAQIEAGFKRHGLKTDKTLVDKHNTDILRIRMSMQHVRSLFMELGGRHSKHHIAGTVTLYYLFVTGAPTVEIANKGVELSEVGPVAPSAPPIEEEVGELPDGWEQRTDFNGRSVFVDHHTRQVSVRRPVRRANERQFLQRLDSFEVIGPEPIPELTPSEVPHPPTSPWPLVTPPPMPQPVGTAPPQSYVSPGPEPTPPQSYIMLNTQFAGTAPPQSHVTPYIYPQPSINPPPQSYVISAQQLVVSTTPPQGSATTPPQGSATTPPQGSATTPPQGSATTPPQGYATTPPQGSATTPPQGSANTPPQGSATTPPQGSATTPPQGSATAPPQGSATTPPQGSATTPPQRSATTPPQGSTTTLPQGSATTPPQRSATTPPQGSTTTPPQGSTTTPPQGSATPPPQGSATPPPQGSAPQEHRGGEGHIEGGDHHPPERMEQSQASQIENTTPYPVEGASLHPSAHQNEDLTDHIWGLPPGWKVVSMNGAVLYYINQMESLRSETKPEEKQLNPQPHLPPGWEAMVTTDGCVYYKDHCTRTTTWTKPLHDSVQRSVSTTSDQIHPHLPPGWEAMVTTNGRVYYMNHTTRTTTWTKPLPPPNESVQRSPNIPSAMEQQQDPDLPPGWERKTAPDGRVYYRDNNTRTTTWTLPLPPPNDHIQRSPSTLPPPNDHIQRSPSTLPPQNDHIQRSPSTLPPQNDHIQRSPSTSSVVQQDPDLPPGWEMRKNVDGRFYYIDHNTKTTTWDHPLKKATEGTGPLPPGWERKITPDGRVFFVDHTTKSTQWEDPRLLNSKPAPKLEYSRNYKQKLTNFRSRMPSVAGDQRLNIPVTRSNVLEDSFTCIMKVKDTNKLRLRPNVTFTGEKGYDYGGLSREWFHLLSKEMFNPYYGLFEYAASDDYTLQISPNSGLCNPGHLEYFRFYGRVCGLAIYNNMIIDAFFIRPFYKMMLGKKVTFEDMQSVDVEMYNSMKYILENDPEPLCLSFSINKEALGEVQEVELKPNGKDIPVTEMNKKEYVELVIKWRFTERVQDQMSAFMKGFSDVIPPNLIQVFDERELEYLMGGLAEIDVEDWKKNTDYDGYTANDNVIVWFWKAVSYYDNEMRARLLQFVTGTSKVPMNGFAELQGSQGPRKFCIKRYGSPESFPRAHTCFNRMDLPPYTQYYQLKDKLTTAIENTEGFSGVD